jgi:hypothetical protein
MLGVGFRLMRDVLKERFSRPYGAVEGSWFLTMGKPVSSAVR